MAYHRHHRADSYEAALKHLEEAKQFSYEIGGYDKDVKEYFFNLSKKELEQILSEYGRKFGAKPEDYARKTFNSWKSGKRGMSGLVAKRLFDLLPPKMPMSKKLELADNLWRHFAPETMHYFTVNKEANINDLSQVIQAKLNETITLHNIPNNLKNRFNWLAGGDINVEEQILNYFRQREKELILEKIRLEMPILQNQLRTRPDITSSLKSELRINNNKIIITIVDASERLIEETPTPYVPLPPPQKANTSKLIWILCSLVFLIFLIWVTKK